MDDYNKEKLPTIVESSAKTKQQITLNFGS